jgi:hypothetical protein
MRGLAQGWNRWADFNPELLTPAFKPVCTGTHGNVSRFNGLWRQCDRKPVKRLSNPERFSTGPKAGVNHYFGCSRSKWLVSAISFVIVSGSVAS